MTATTAELVMDQRVVWDRCKMKEVEQAKQFIMKYKRMGHEILRPDGSIMERFNPSLEEVIIKAERVARSIMMILSEKGDERLVWDMDNGPEAKEAKKRFADLLKKGYKAYSVDRKGKKNKRIEEFDVEAEEILMVPETVKG